MRLLLIAMALVVALGLAAAVGQVSGLAAYHELVGYQAPVWHPSEDRIYLLERRTRGVVIGPGWEHFSPPAEVWLLSDVVTLLALELGDGTLEPLHRFSVDPHIGRWVRRYHNRIFGYLAASVESDGDRVEVRARISLPRVPSSEVWTYEAKIDSSGEKIRGWLRGQDGNTSSPDQVLRDGVELMTVLDQEAYGAAVLAVRADQNFEVLLRTDAFDVDAVDPTDLASRSRREQIEHVRRFTAMEHELRERYRAQGLREGDAALRAHDDMEEMGLLPRRPRIVAAVIDAPPPAQTVFRIPGGYFEVGLFKDIRAAIEAPGTEIKAATGDHLKYYDDDVGPRLRRHRESGVDSFVVETDGVHYLISRSEPADGRAAR